MVEHYPFLRRFTADALFCLRPSARAILEAGRDFLLAVKDNQPDLFEAVLTSFLESELTCSRKTVVSQAS